jgi:hypothetical protein
LEWCLQKFAFDEDVDPYYERRETVRTPALPRGIKVMFDGFVKSPDAALRFILPRLSPGQACGVRYSTPHSSGFARLACGLFTKPSHFRGF